MAEPLADALVKVLTDKELRSHLVRVGLAQATSFNSESCARATLQVYYQAAGKVPPVLASMSGE